MTEPPKLVNVEYVLFDMDGLLLINSFSIFIFLIYSYIVRSADRLGEDLLERNKYVDRFFIITEADVYERLSRSIDEILGKYGIEMSWDIKSGCMGKCKLL
jgi:hypothetical protein